MSALINDWLRDYSAGEPEHVDTVEAARLYDIAPESCRHCQQEGEHGWGLITDAGDGDISRQCANCGRNTVVRRSNILSVVVVKRRAAARKRTRQ